MELKAKLQEPFSEEERLEFIVEQNHKLGYKIMESQNGLEAWGYTEEELAEIEKKRLIAEYKDKLNELDEKSIRAVRAKLAGKSTPEDDVFLAQLETQAEEYRELIKELQK